MKLFRKTVGLLILVFALLHAVVPMVAAADSNSAVVLMYHRFGEGDYPTTNIKLDQFDAHLAFLQQEGFTFLSMEDFKKTMQSGDSFPDKSVLITIDDAYASFMRHGWPRLKAAGIPATLFVATDAVDRGGENYLNWSEIRQMADEGLTIGHHTASHLHAPHEGAAVSAADIKKASARFEAELGFVPDVIAYPYGEFDKAIQQVVIDQGFTLAFSQYSSPVTPSADTYSLARFAMNERYGVIDRFKLVSRSRALPVTEVTPVGALLHESANPPLIGFTVDSAVNGLSALACYPSHMGQAATLVRPTDDRIEVRFDKPFPKGRNRLNCTMPGPDGRWYWYGRFFWLAGGALD